MAQYLSILVLAALALTACGRGDETPNLLNIRQSNSAGPDEFAILPTKPLVMPDDLAALPEPTPGAGNLSDPTPVADAASALGGNAAVLARQANDGALLAHSRRFGVDPAIRAKLAAADLEFRRQNNGRILERIFSVNVYFDSYEPFELDQYAELERLRRLGIRTPAVPPESEEE